ncbi:hypothetical protein YSA_06376 [Pseudomonas putida ND6]|uniref:Uncharacterized protein n=1 Tax=Pseudomonas putida ND6 TaxID=231023 RepID=I3UXI2_PSEPU|nr:hypothetical protein YSA_06376 [Pseudomonas putida ND6]
MDFESGIEVYQIKKKVLTQYSMHGIGQRKNVSAP